MKSSYYLNRCMGTPGAAWPDSQISGARTKLSGYGTNQVSVSPILKDLSLEMVSRDNPVLSNSRPLRVFLGQLELLLEFVLLVGKLDHGTGRSLERLSRAIRSASEAG